MATMLNGAAVMDGALLLIAANETCPQPQTSEHLAAVEIMRLEHIIILQNKIDLIRYTWLHSCLDAGRQHSVCVACPDTQGGETVRDAQFIALFHPCMLTTAVVCAGRQLTGL